MAKKTYKNKGIPVKGSEMRARRTIKLTDSTWNGLDEVAELCGASRGDLVEWMAGTLTKNKEQMAKIAANEGITVEELIKKLFEGLPTQIMQLRANKPQPDLPLHVKLDEESK